MVNRIKRIIEKENMNAAAFADKIGVNRATMNHILNGRNNPSLDVLMKIVSQYKNINLEWLALGTPPMYKGENSIIEPGLFDENLINPSNHKEESKYSKETEVKPPENPQNSFNNQEFIDHFSKSVNIDKVIIFFKNKTFITLKPEE